MLIQDRIKFTKFICHISRLLGRINNLSSLIYVISCVNICMISCVHTIHIGKPWGSVKLACVTISI